MGIVIFIVVALLSAAGGYFILPAVALIVPLVSLAALGIYYGARIFSEEKLSQKRKEISGKVVDLEKFRFERKQMNGRLAVPEEIGAEVIFKIEQLKDKLPYDAFVDWSFEVIGRLWVCRLMVRSTAGQFYSSGAAKSPVEALDMASAILRRQVREWLTARNLSGNEASPPSMHHAAPRVLIVDDDVDAALMIESVFRQHGCITSIATSVSEAQRKLSLGEADLVILDWRLSDSLNADAVVENTVARISSNSGLRHQFETHPAQVITFSSYDKKDIHLPKSPYFKHVDHWQKALGYGELSQRTSGILHSAGF